MYIQGLISSEWWQLGEWRAFYTRIGFLTLLITELYPSRCRSNWHSQEIVVALSRESNHNIAEENTIDVRVTNTFE